MAPQPAPPGPSETGWPDGEHDWRADHEAGPPEPMPSTAAEGPPSGGGRRRWLALAGVAVVAAAAGAGITVALRQATPASPAAAAPQSAHSLLPAPGGPGPGAGAPAGGAPAGGLAPGQEQLFLQLTGQVTAVSTHSITISGGGHTTTAAITAATKFTGGVKRISAVKAGDSVIAAMTGSGGRLSVVTLQDPVSAP